MHLSDLLPDVQFHALPRNEKALRHSFEVKRAALGPYIVERWGWDEAVQMRTHRDRSDEKPFFKIARDGRDVGTASFMRRGDYIRLGEFYLFPDRRGKATRHQSPPALPLVGGQARGASQTGTS
jgi:hypothetical protein